MKEVFIDPKGFQGQIDSFSSGVDSLKSITYVLEKQGLCLESVDKYLQCIDMFNETMKDFVEFLSMDTNSMREIKAKWMNTDSDIATKTLGQVLRGE